MDNNCCNKKTKRSPDEKKLIVNRLNRISGQINGITKMIGNDAYCNDVLIQLSAVKNSALPIATTRISALFVTSARFCVFEWQTVTVPLALSIRSAIGLPTILLLPMITHSLP